MRLRLLATAVLLACSQPLASQQVDTPLRQSAVSPQTVVRTELTLRDASRDDRWLGLGVRDVRWAPDGSAIYFRWNEDPDPNQVPEADPWYKADPDGRWVEGLTSLDESRSIPAGDLVWSLDGQRAAWVSGPTVHFFNGRASRPVVTLEASIRSVRFGPGGDLDIVSGEALYRYEIEGGALALVARRHTVEVPSRTAAGAWLAQQQRDLFEHVRDQERRQAASGAARRRVLGEQAIPLKPTQSLEDIQASPDDQFLTILVREPAEDRPVTQYIDYLDPSGYATPLEARSKAGEPRDVFRMGIVRRSPELHPDSVAVMWVTLQQAGDQETVPRGPYWSLDGTRALVQLIGEEHKDVWYAELDPETGATRLITHDHDDAWIGGPPIQANYLQPALLEWLPDGSWVFASERSGWSHLYRVDPSGAITPLTSGPWEVRTARLSRDRGFWLLQTSREHPSDDHLYRMPATGGPMVRLTEGQGRYEGWLSPSGDRMAVLHSTATTLPDLYTARTSPGNELSRITESGTEHFWATELAAPEIVSFSHPDGNGIWGALYTPSVPHPDRPAVIHVHGGGYRQFAHRGWSVYGWALHVGFLNYLVQQGYTVLDFDYRGGAGFGRDYRTDVARSMGIKDADGVAAAARYLTAAHGIHADRIGMHGVSYGGFLTLMTLFRHPGVVSAGIARASVTDWAHYSDGWTSRILGVPALDPEAYERSSPIYYADGLEDALLITHGIMDDNVHFQDAARLIQKLIELEKDFEVMVYPVEPHTIETEASRYDFVRRAMAFFERHLLEER